MYKHILENIERLNLMTIIPLVVFFVFFCAVIIYSLRADKKLVNHMAQLPLEDQNI